MKKIRARIIQAGWKAFNAESVPSNVTEAGYAAAACEALRIAKERIQAQSYIAYRSPESVIDKLLTEIETGSLQSETKRT